MWSTSFSVIPLPKSLYAMIQLIHLVAFGTTPVVRSARSPNTSSWTAAFRPFWIMSYGKLRQSMLHPRRTVYWLVCIRLCLRLASAECINAHNVCVEVHSLATTNISYCRRLKRGVCGFWRHVFVCVVESINFVSSCWRESSVRGTCNRKYVHTNMCTIYLLLYLGTIAIAHRRSDSESRQKPTGKACAVVLREVNIQTNHFYLSLPF